MCKLKTKIYREFISVSNSRRSAGGKGLTNSQQRQLLWDRDNKSLSPAQLYNKWNNILPLVPRKKEE